MFNTDSGSVKQLVIESNIVLPTAFTLDATASFASTSSFTEAASGFITFPQGLTVTGSLLATGEITGSGLLMTTRGAASASAGGTYTSAEQDLLNQIRDTLIKYGMLS